GQRRYARALRAEQLLQGLNRVEQTGLAGTLDGDRPSADREDVALRSRVSVVPKTQGDVARTAGWVYHFANWQLDARGAMDRGLQLACGNQRFAGGIGAEL